MQSLCYTRNIITLSRCYCAPSCCCCACAAGLGMTFMLGASSAYFIWKFMRSARSRFVSSILQAMTIGSKIQFAFT